MDFFGYLESPLGWSFLNSPMWAGKLNEYYPNLKSVIEKKSSERNITNWLCTSNITMSNYFFYKYMIDSENLFNWIKGFSSVGHELERNLGVYYILNDWVKCDILRDMITHYQLDSHKTQGILIADYNSEIIKLSKNSKLK